MQQILCKNKFFKEHIKIRTNKNKQEQTKKIGKKFRILINKGRQKEVYSGLPSHPQTLYVFQKQGLNSYKLMMNIFQLIKMNKQENCNFRRNSINCQHFAKIEIFSWLDEVKIFYTWIKQLRYLILEKVGMGKKSRLWPEYTPLVNG